MKILVLNCGSSSIKYQLIDMENNAEVLAKGLMERIGLEMGEFTHKAKGKDKYYVQVPIADHAVGIDLLLKTLTDKDLGVISNVNEISACGHRVAHGGEYFPESTIIGEKEMKEIEKLCVIAPLHNPGNLLGIKVMKSVLPQVKQVGVFDTSFHQTMPAEAFLYAIPYEYYTQQKIRRYGFHGTSHKYVAPKAAELLGMDWNTKKIIVCHLGNGASICAVNCGQSVDTSMGFTPVEGLIMGTRTGDLDAGVLMYIAENENLDYKGMNTLVNKKSGLQGISGGKSDMRDIRAGKEAGDERCTHAFNMFAYRVKKYIGAYTAAMNGVDIVAMTGGIGENAWFMREAILENLDCLGIVLDKKANQEFAGVDGVISTAEGKVKVLSVTTNEELVIALDTYELVK
ncbi:MAG: acetate kinase [Bacteroidales bacterium]|nr:acetate kinase [Bacteroidales bacterium]MDD4209459.1 acetate kinase [Bacteroidales bacterium]